MRIQINKSAIHIMQGDITHQNTDAIVNAANNSLMGGGGVDGAIHRAGGPEILAENKKIVKEKGPLPTGEAVITTAGKMPSKYVIHTVGPIYKNGASGEAELLTNAYRNSLVLAAEKQLESISFPSISTGVFGYPIPDAADIAIESVIQFLRENVQIKLVRFVLFDDRTFLSYQQALNKIGKD